MKGSKAGVYLTPVRHRPSKTIYRNGYFDNGLWHCVDRNGKTFVFQAVDCEFVFEGQHGTKVAKSA